MNTAHINPDNQPETVGYNRVIQAVPPTNPPRAGRIKWEMTNT
jgi:hypothetical protein